MEGDNMKRYQEPEMELIRFESVNTAVEDSTLYLPGNGSNTGGGTGESGGWGDF